MSVPLCASVLTAEGAVIPIKHDLAGVAFRKIANGGTASISLDVVGDAAVPPRALTPGGVVRLHDARTANLIADADLTDPGLRSDSGDVWQSTALGWTRRLRNPAFPYVYVDRNLTPFFRADNATPGADTSIGDDPLNQGEDAILIRFPDGQKLVTNSRAAMRYDLYLMTGQNIARYDFNVDFGKTLSSLRGQSVVRDSSAGTLERDHAADVAGIGSVPQIIVTHYPTNIERVELRILWSGAATTVADDLTFATFRGFTIQGVRYKVDGTRALTAADYASGNPSAEAILADVAGRLLGVDPLLSSLPATGVTFDQLAYHDPVTGEKIADDVLTKLGPTWRYYLTHRGSTGKPGFVLAQWSETPRYIVRASSGKARLAKPETTVIDEVLVRYLNAIGLPRYRTRTQVTDSRLGEAQQAVLDLSSEGSMSPTQADQFGDAYLAAHAKPKASGTVVIGGPVWDDLTSQWVAPHEVEPGYVVRLPDLDVYPGAASTTSSDGRQTFRAISVDYRDGQATVALDAPPLDTVSEFDAMLRKFQLARRR